jgi:sugar phosphate permease
MFPAKIKGKIYYGWWIVAACTALIVYFAGAYFYGFTAFFNPIVDEFGWSYALVALASSLQAFESGLLSPVVGVLVDRFGSRKLLIFSASVMGLSLLLFSRVQSLPSFYAVTIMMAIASSFAYPVTMMTAIAKWCGNRMSLSMGILTAGHAAGGLLVPVIVWLIYQVGWREAMIVIGAGALILGIPLATLVKTAPPGLLTAGKGEGKGAAGNQRESLTARQAVKSRDFWFLGFGALLARVAAVAVVVHQIPYLVSIGIPRTSAGLMVIVFALANISGRLFLGWLGDVLDKRYCFAAAAALVGAGIFVFATSTSPSYLIPSLAAIGVGFGGSSIIASLQADLFGTRSYGTIQGFVMAILTVGNVIAPPLAGRVFDVTGTYQPAFLALGLCSLMAIPLLLSIRRISRTPARQEIAAR